MSERMPTFPADRTRPGDPAATARPRRRRRLTALALLLVVAGLVPAYAPPLDAPPVFDSSQIWRDPARAMESLSFEELRRASAHVDMEDARWLTNATFALNRMWAGRDTTSFRVVNLGIHALAVLAVFAFLRETLRLAGRDDASATRVALLAAGLFAWNPVQVQSVTYIWQRATCLAGLLTLVAMWLFTRGLRRRGRARILHFGLIGPLFALALATKQNTAVLPAVMGLHAWLFASRRRLSTLLFVALGVAGVGALLFLALAPSWLGTYDLKEILRRPGSFEISGHLFTQARVALRLASLLLLPLPSRLSLEHHVVAASGPLSPWTNLPAVAAVGALVVGSLWMARRRPLLAFPVLWYFLMLVVESTIVQVNLMREHRLYLPGVGPLLGVALALEALGWGPGRRPRLAAALVAIALAGLLAGTRVRNGVWTSPHALWADAAAKSPREPRPEWNLGSWWELQGRRLPRGSPEQGEAWDRAEAHYRRALALDPEELIHRHHFARFQMLRGRWPKPSSRSPLPGRVLVLPLSDRSGHVRQQLRRDVQRDLARHLEREVPVRTRLGDSQPSAGGSGDRSGPTILIDTTVLHIGFLDRSEGVEVRCRLRSWIHIGNELGSFATAGVARLRAADTPAGRTEGVRGCVRSAARALASRELAPIVQHLLLFAKHFRGPPVAAEVDRGSATD